MKPSLGQSALNIAAVERDTGIGKDTLRVWERRYGFPQPQRNDLGERLYPDDQIERLRLIKRLMDRGQRPGKLVAEPTDVLKQRLESRSPAKETGTETDDSVSAASDTTSSVHDADTSTDWLINHLRAKSVEAVRVELAQRLTLSGLQQFICETLPGLNQRIGEAWMAGEIGIFEEHLYTEQIQNLLRNAIHALPHPVSRPQVLLTTLKDEEHVLGLLMAEALLTAEGTWCLSLGAQTPVSDLVGAAHGTTADIIALSFSSAYPWRKARDALIELRRGLPEQVELWVGGGTLSRHKRSLPGIRCFSAIGEIPLAIAAWREAHSESEKKKARHNLHRA
jgi:DNA-binding transcriptional MerR regulator